ncbi:hypothetical protein L6452_19336 [Arctium lappa]|uniref:Uncharacterized protein n=1 Tax=Arctium lappa TaxID=4217 RepID=A0ACB9B962_ARCLA|nr:hypothetical protein L6452_19336 [Arctium lappa]
MKSTTCLSALADLTIFLGEKTGLNGGTTDGRDNSYGFVPLDRPINWKELTVDSATKDSILSVILVATNTELPVTKQIKMNLRWGVNIPTDYEKQLPYLRVNKIKTERIDEVNEEKRNKKQKIEGDSGEFEMLKDIKELQSVQQQWWWRWRRWWWWRKEGSGLDGVEQWMMKKSGDANGQREMKKNVSSVDVGSELQRAIKAASS